MLQREALVVLGPWLTALGTCRPEVTWPYIVASTGVEPLASGTHKADALRRNADAVLHASGTVTEAVPGAHGAGIPNLVIPAGASAPEAARCLYDGGVRRLLLHGGQRLADSFIAVGMRAPWPFPSAPGNGHGLKSVVRVSGGGRDWLGGHGTDRLSSVLCGGHRDMVRPKAERALPLDQLEEYGGPTPVSLVPPGAAASRASQGTKCADLIPSSTTAASWS